MPSTVSNGVELHYERHGVGPKLLYCNGSGATLDSVRPLLAMFASRFDVLAFDYRGLGASAPATAPYTMADIAADVAGVLDAVGWERPAVAGLSFGGMVAQEFAVTFPDRVDRLALLATSPGGAFSSYPLDELVALPAEQRTARTPELTDRRWTPEWLAAHAPQAVLAAGFAAGHDGGGTEVELRGRALQLQARKGHDVLTRLHRITCPTFVGAGQYDDIAPVVNAQAIIERVPGAELHVYDGGHLFLVQDPRAWPDVAAFLAAD